MSRDFEWEPAAMSARQAQQNVAAADAMPKCATKCRSPHRWHGSPCRACNCPSSWTDETEENP